MGNPKGASCIAFLTMSADQPSCVGASCDIAATATGHDGMTYMTPTTLKTPKDQCLPAAQHCVTSVRPRQDCPGKATHTVLLACVSAADICHEQTLQTLRFAERARSRNLPGAAPLPPTRRFWESAPHPVGLRMTGSSCSSTRPGHPVLTAHQSLTGAIA